MRKKFAIIAFLLLLPVLAWGMQQVSSINPMLPAPNTPLNNAVLQQNFQHAYNDINYILSILGGLGNLSTLNSPLLPVNGGIGLTSACPSGDTIISNGTVYHCGTGGGGGGGGYTYEQEVSTGLSATTTDVSTNVLWYSSASGNKTDNIPTASGSRQIITITDVYGNAGTYPITAVPTSGSILGNASAYTNYGSITLYDSQTLNQWVSQ